MLTASTSVPIIRQAVVELSLTHALSAVRPIFNFPLVSPQISHVTAIFQLVLMFSLALQTNQKRWVQTRKYLLKGMLKYLFSVKVQQLVDVVDKNRHHN